MESTEPYALSWSSGTVGSRMLTNFICEALKLFCYLFSPC